MKLNIQFGSETRFDQPIRCLTQTGAQWSPGIRVLWRELAIAGRTKPVRARIDRWNFPGKLQSGMTTDVTKLCPTWDKVLQADRAPKTNSGLLQIRSRFEAAAERIRGAYLHQPSDRLPLIKFCSVKGAQRPHLQFQGFHGVVLENISELSLSHNLEINSRQGANAPMQNSIAKPLRLSPIKNQRRSKTCHSISEPV